MRKISVYHWHKNDYDKHVILLERLESMKPKRESKQEPFWYEYSVEKYIDDYVEEMLRQHKVYLKNKLKEFQKRHPDEFI